MRGSEGQLFEVRALARPGAWAGKDPMPSWTLTTYGLFTFTEIRAYSPEKLWRDYHSSN